MGMDLSVCHETRQTLGDSLVWLVLLSACYAGLIEKFYRSV